jgi:outer membrane protein assembly factor BamB
MPVVADKKVMIADRAYDLGIFDAANGKSLGSQSRVAATGISENGKFVYLRKTDGNLEKIDSNGRSLWSTAAHLGAIPTAPTEKNGIVYVCSGKGTLSAVAASDGKMLWQYQVSPQLFVMASVACDGRNAYVTAFDGTLTALKCAN